MNAFFDKLSPLFNIAARIFMSAIFINAGYGKIGGYAGTQGYMESMGVPGMLLPAVIFVELIGGLALLVGFQTRLAAFLIAGFTLLSAVIFHWDWDNQQQAIAFMKNLAITGGLLMFVQYGAGKFAIDKR